MNPPSGSLWLDSTPTRSAGKATLPGSRPHILARGRQGGGCIQPLCHWSLVICYLSFGETSSVASSVLGNSLRPRSRRPVAVSSGVGQTDRPRSQRSEIRSQLSGNASFVIGHWSLVIWGDILGRILRPPQLASPPSQRPAAVSSGVGQTDRARSQQPGARGQKSNNDECRRLLPQMTNDK